MFFLQLSAWSTCTSGISSSDETQKEPYMKLALQPAIGFSRRNLTCIDEEGAETDMRYDLKKKKCLLRNFYHPLHDFGNLCSSWCLHVTSMMWLFQNFLLHN